MTLFRSAELQGKNPVEEVLTIAKDTISSNGKPKENVKMAA
jgi:hypothetical protein